MKEKATLQDKVVSEYTLKLNKLEGAKKEEVNAPTPTETTKIGEKTQM